MYKSHKNSDENPGKILKVAAQNFHETAIEMMENVINFDLSKLNVENLQQFNLFFKLYQKFFNKNYSEEESAERINIFKDSILTAQQHNKNLLSRFKMGINELSDMRWVEILKYKLGFILEKLIDVPKSSSPETITTVASEIFTTTLKPPSNNDSDIPESWDWRKYGILTPPRNQGKCGSCWSFAAAAVLESHNMKRQIYEGKFDPKKQITVSEQNMIDCSAEFGTLGCDGGMPQQAFKYVNSNGIMSEEDYPYIGKKQECSYNPAKKVDVIVSKGQRLKTGDDEELAKTIYKYGPVTSAIHITKGLVAYKNGIFEDTNCDPTKVNHAVVTVGYTPEYFIVRNSWGTKWGESGYVKVSRRETNHCGISKQNYYPVLSNAVETKEIKHKLVEINN